MKLEYATGCGVATNQERYDAIIFFYNDFEGFNKTMEGTERKMFEVANIAMPLNILIQLRDNINTCIDEILMNNNSNSEEISDDIVPSEESDEEDSE